MRTTNSRIESTINSSTFHLNSPAIALYRLLLFHPAMKRDFISAASFPPVPSSAVKPSLQGQQGANPQMTSAQVVNEVRHRNGTVLDPSTLIKVDDYLFKLQASRPNWFPRRISGAEDLRLADGTSILGVAQPTLPGIRGILDSLNAGRNVLAASFESGAYANKKKVLWINLREEPLLYLNGRPVVLREREEPFRNMETFRGISESRLRDLEWRFKEDVVAEAQKCGGSVLLHEEEADNILVEKWESAPPSAVMTAEDVFFQLRQEGYRVRYERLPCTSGQAPHPSFFDELLKFVMTTDRDTWVVFNCQSGNARSTLGMIASYAIQSWRGFWGLSCVVPVGVVGDEEATLPAKKRAGMKDKVVVIDEESPELVDAPLTPPPGHLTSGTFVLPPVPSPAIPDEERDETGKDGLHHRPLLAYFEHSNRGPQVSCESSQRSREVISIVVCSSRVRGSPALHAFDPLRGVSRRARK